MLHTSDAPRDLPLDTSGLPDATSAEQRSIFSPLNAPPPLAVPFSAYDAPHHPFAVPSSAPRQIPVHDLDSWRRRCASTKRCLQSSHHPRLERRITRQSHSQFQTQAPDRDQYRDQSCSPAPRSPHSIANSTVNLDPVQAMPTIDSAHHGTTVPDWLSERAPSVKQIPLSATSSPDSLAQQAPPPSAQRSIASTADSSIRRYVSRSKDRDQGSPLPSGHGRLGVPEVNRRDTATLARNPSSASAVSSRCASSLLSRRTPASASVTSITASPYTAQLEPASSSPSLHHPSRSRPASPLAFQLGPGLKANLPASGQGQRFSSDAMAISKSDSSSNGTAPPLSSDPDPTPGAGTMARSRFPHVPFSLSTTDARQHSATENGRAASKLANLCAHQMGDLPNAQSVRLPSMASTAAEDHVYNREQNVDAIFQLEDDACGSACLTPILRARLAALLDEHARLVRAMAKKGADISILKGELAEARAHLGAAEASARTYANIAREAYMAGFNEAARQTWVHRNGDHPLAQTQVKVVSPPSPPAAQCAGSSAATRYDPTFEETHQWWVSTNTPATTASSPRNERTRLPQGAPEESIDAALEDSHHQEMHKYDSAELASVTLNKLDGTPSQPSHSAHSHRVSMGHGHAFPQWKARTEGRRFDPGHSFASAEENEALSKHPDGSLRLQASVRQELYPVAQNARFNAPLVSGTRMPYSIDEQSGSSRRSSTPLSTLPKAGQSRDGVYAEGERYRQQCEYGDDDTSHSSLVPFTNPDSLVPSLSRWTDKIAGTLSPLSPTSLVSPALDKLKLGQKSRHASAPLLLGHSSPLVGLGLDIGGASALEEQDGASLGHLRRASAAITTRVCPTTPLSPSGGSSRWSSSSERGVPSHRAASRQPVSSGSRPPSSTASNTSYHHAIPSYTSDLFAPTPAAQESTLSPHQPRNSFHSTAIDSMSTSSSPAKPLDTVSEQYTLPVSPPHGTREMHEEPTLQQEEWWVQHDEWSQPQEVPKRRMRRLPKNVSQLSQRETLTSSAAIQGRDDALSVPQQDSTTSNGQGGVVPQAARGKQTNLPNLSTDEVEAYRTIYRRMADELPAYDLQHFKALIWAFDQRKLTLEGTDGLLARVRNLLLGPFPRGGSNVSDPKKYARRLALAGQFEVACRSVHKPY